MQAAHVPSRMIRIPKPTRRSIVKWLHWLTLPLFIWFLFITPEDAVTMGKHGFRIHSVLGLIFVSLVLGWTALYLRRGLVGRPGPKLSPRLKTLHRALHHTLVWGLFSVALTGFLLGLTSTVQLWAGGIVPIAIPLGLPRLNALVGQVHILEFYVLAGLAAGHALFHIWRHIRLRDNALRIMLPRLFYRFL